MRNPRSILFFSLMMAVSLLGAWLAGEALVYVFFHRQIAFYPRYLTSARYGDFQIRGNRPGVHYRHRSDDGQWDFYINHQGFRDRRDFVYSKPPGTLRILVLGDSFTMGYEVAQEDPYPAVLERELKRRGHAAEVINSGVSGFSTAEELVFLEQEGFKYHPDLVLLGYFINDPEDNVRSGLFEMQDRQLILRSKEYLPYMGIREFLNAVPLYRWLAEHSYLQTYLNGAATRFFKEKVRQKNAREMTGTTAEQLTAVLVRRMAETVHGQKIPLVLMDIPVPALTPSLPADSPIRQIPDAFLDGASVLRPYADRQVLYRPHGSRHWTPFSHRIAGEALADLMERRFLAKQGSGG